MKEIIETERKSERERGRENKKIRIRESDPLSLASWKIFDPELGLGEH